MNFRPLFSCPECNGLAEPIVIDDTFTVLLWACGECEYTGKTDEMVEMKVDLPLIKSPFLI